MNNKNIALSVRDKLLNHAKKNKRPFNEILQYYGIERFLYRLSLSDYKDILFLKGALLFFVWQISTPRPTRDIDLLGRTSNSPENMMHICREICTIPCIEDGIYWKQETIRLFPTQNQREYEGFRINFNGSLDTAVIHMQIDVGFSDVVYPKPAMMDYPCILNMPQPKLIGYTPESMIAEKAHSVIVLGELNSRIKDYFDIWFLSRQFEFKGQRLLDAIAKTFVNRKIDTKLFSVSAVFSTNFKHDQEKSMQWQSFISKNELTIAPTLFEIAMDEIATFIFPVIKAFETGKTFTKHWNKITWV